MTASANVQELQGLHNSWQQERTTLLGSLHTAHDRAQQLDATHNSLETFHTSLVTAERNALIEQIQQLCLDKLALKRQLDSRTKLYQPAASAVAGGHTLDEVQLRHDVDEMRLTVQRLRQDNQYVMALSQQKEAELTAMEQTLHRMKREKERAEQKLLEAERREVRERERLAGMEEVLRQCRDRERQLLEEKLGLQRDLLRRRREDAVAAATGGRRAMSVGSVEEAEEEDGIDSAQSDSKYRQVDASHLRLLAADNGGVSDSGGEDDVFVEPHEHRAAAADSTTQEEAQHWST